MEVPEELDLVGVLGLAAHLLEQAVPEQVAQEELLVEMQAVPEQAAEVEVQRLAQ